MGRKDHLFKPGQSGNPKGRVAVPEHLRKYPKLIKEEVQRMIAHYGAMPTGDLRAIAEDINTPGLVRSIVLNLLDKDKLPILLDRTIGKVTEHIETKNIYAEIETPKLIEIGKEAIKKLESGEDK